jgi:plasmid stabilization system protein ParE
MDVDFHPEATAELAESTDWYAGRSRAVAQDFLVAVDLVISSIVDDPARFAKIDEAHRSCSVARFPFQIVFRHDESRVVIIAVAHAKRRSGYWRQR